MFAIAPPCDSDGVRLPRSHALTSPEVLRLDDDGSAHPITDCGVEQRLLRGEVLLVRGGAGAGLSELLTAVWSAIEAEIGPQRTADLRARGLGSLHEAITIDELDRIHTELTNRLQPLCLGFTEAFTRRLFNRRRFWVNLNAVMRFYLPNAVMQKSYGQLKKKHGKLVQHGPHYDYWQGVALNALNIWIALDDVEAGNGMAIWTREWGSVLPRGLAHVRNDQRLHAPLEIVCQAGDIVLFHSQHLHGGILNRTGKTRSVLTTRVVLEPPRHPRLGTTLTYYPAWLIRRGVRGATRAVMLLDRVRPANLLRAYEQKVGKGAPGHEERRVEWLDGLLGKHWFAAVESRGIDSVPPNPGIEIVDDRFIKVTVDGEAFVVSRLCPHQGGDLACGHVRDGLIYCPLHNQPFDPRTGEAVGPGAGLRPLITKTPALT